MRHRTISLIFATALSVAGGMALAQKAVPPGLQPLPEPPPPPPLPTENAEPAVEEPVVTIVKRGEDTVEEYRINGQLYMMKVTPPRGASFYLIDRRGDGVFTRQESLDSGLRPPMWVLFRF